MHGGVADRAELVEAEQALAGQPGVDEQRFEAGGAEQAPVGRFASELRAPRHVFVRIGAGGEIEHRRAPLPDRDPQQRVERRASRRRRPVRLREERLESGPVE